VGTDLLELCHEWMQSVLLPRDDQAERCAGEQQDRDKDNPAAPPYEAARPIDVEHVKQSIEHGPDGAAGLRQDLACVGGSGHDRRVTEVPTPTWADGREFEEYAARFLSAEWGIDLACRPVTLPGGVTKKFDLVSADGHIVGDAKYYKNIAVPAAKWSTIAEYVWLLQHVPNAKRRFMAFGLDVEVATRWLSRFRGLTEGIEFFYLDGITLQVL
jgi:hypothetical protein